MACELFQHSLCKIRVRQGVSIDRSVVEIEQTWINKGQNCQQEECPVACEDLLLNSIWKAKSDSRTEPKAPRQARNFLRTFSKVNTYSKMIFKCLPFLFSVFKCSKTSQVPKWPKVLEGRNGSLWVEQVEQSPCLSVRGIGPPTAPPSTLPLFFIFPPFLIAYDVFPAICRSQVPFLCTA